MKKGVVLLIPFLFLCGCDQKVDSGNSSINQTDFEYFNVLEYSKFEIRNNLTGDYYTYFKEGLGNIWSIASYKVFDLKVYSDYFSVYTERKENDGIKTTKTDIYDRNIYSFYLSMENNSWEKLILYF